MKKYFIVRCKCGHVGRSMYIPMDFPIYAENAREAAQIARQRPGVKHNQQDAIISVKEISMDDYLAAMKIFQRDIYWLNGRLGTKNHQALLYTRIEPETQKQTVSTSRISSRKFRYRKARHYESSLRKEIIREYGLVV